MRGQETILGTRPGVRAWLVAGVTLAAAAALVRYRVRRLERAHPPEGKFVTVDDVRLHYIERGQGQPLVLLHGIGCTASDFMASGLMDAVARQYRVIAFDRPGYGYSETPRGQGWPPAVQAEILYRALQKIGCENPVVVGHSWGTQVAISLALQHPEYVRGLVLLSGYSFPTVRPDFLLSGIHAIPVVGSLLLHTVSSLLGWLARPVTQRIAFGPPPAPAGYADFPYAMMLRPSQLKASMRDNLSMIPTVLAARRHYRELKLPVVIMAGEEDRLVSAEHHSMRLHRLLPNSELQLIPGQGHMIHHTAARQVMNAINTVFRRSAGIRNPTRGENMNHAEQRSRFSEEFTRRFEEFARWAIDNRPDKSHPLALSDFREFGMEMEKVVLGLDDSYHTKGAEPAQGGEQYVQVTPSPWP